MTLKRFYYYISVIPSAKVLRITNTIISRYLAFRRLWLRIYRRGRVLKAGQIQLLRQLTLQLLLPRRFGGRLLHFLSNETGYFIRHSVRELFYHSPAPWPENRTWSWSAWQWSGRRPWGRWRSRSTSYSSSPLRLGRTDARRTRCYDPERYRRRTWPGPNLSYRTFAGDRTCAKKRKFEMQRNSCRLDVNRELYLSASSPSKVMTAESARVIAGAEKNSPTITSSNRRKKVFWIS